ncbi:MAG TPA: CopD family protein, partial [Puia sp.]|nr:CopD family protein [Puia sp.]
MGEGLVRLDPGIWRRKEKYDPGRLKNFQESIFIHSQVYSRLNSFAMYNYVKALHIIFIVTWFSGLFYVVRLFIYNTEAGEKPEPEKTIFRKQFSIMIRRLWLGITWPSAILTLIFGPWIWFLLGNFPHWLAVKLFFVIGLYLYHISLHIIYRQQMRGEFRFSSQQLRIWNEIATVFLIAVVFVAVVKQALSILWALVGLIILMIVLMIAIRIYRKIRLKRNSKNDPPS